MLLSGVSRIELTGTPGDLVVFGEGTMPLILDPSGKAMAAAYENNGQRIIWLTHDSWMKPDGLKKADTRRFMENALTLVSGGGKILLVQAETLVPYVKTMGIPFDSFDRVPESLEEYRAVVCYFNTHGPKLMSATEITRLDAFLSRGGSCIGIGIGWVFDSYGAGKQGADIAEEYAGNILLSRFGALWGHAYAAVKGNPNTDPEAGHFRSDIAKALSGFSSPVSYGQEENRRLVRTLTGSKANRAAVKHSLSPELAGRLVTALSSEGRVPVPGEKNPVKLSDTQAVMAVAFAHVFLDRIVEKNPSFAKDLAGFPSFGLSASPDWAESITVTLPAKSTGWISTGAYALPGIPLRISTGNSEAGMRFLVGAHTDNLFSSGREEWQRWPEVAVYGSLRRGLGELTSPFGGIVYLIPDPSGYLGDIDVLIEGCVRYPVYRKGETSEDEWKKALSSTRSPWGEIVSDSLIITTLVSELRKNDAGKACDFWDEVLASYKSCAGFSPRTHRERVTFDVQTSMGYMHNGYPVMAHLDRAGTVLSGALVEPDSQTAYDMWGLFHEFGHNWQKRDYTMSYMGEVTVNIFTMLAYQGMYGLSPGQLRMPKISGEPKLPAYLASPDPSAFSREPFVGLYVFIYLIDAFGWEPLRGVLEDFASLPSVPATDAEKCDLWVRFYSLRTGRNLIPYFKRWGIEAGGGTSDLVNHLNVWLPSAMSDLMK